ncbi:MAG: hypothetical protein PHU07_07350 [Acidocella sp.]|nr:hypothetical protein [Acidocella sp.]
MLKRFLRRLSRFMLAEAVTEIAALRQEVAALRAEAARRDEMAPLVQQMERALLTIALTKNQP